LVIGLECPHARTRQSNEDQEGRCEQDPAGKGPLTIGPLLGRNCLVLHSYGLNSSSAVAPLRARFRIRGRKDTLKQAEGTELGTLGRGCYLSPATAPVSSVGNGSSHLFVAAWATQLLRSCMTMRNCRVCLGQHDAKIHAATLSVHRWFRNEVMSRLEFPDDLSSQIEPVLEAAPAGWVLGPPCQFARPSPAAARRTRIVELPIAQGHRL